MSTAQNITNSSCSICSNTSSSEPKLEADAEAEVDADAEGEPEPITIETAKEALNYIHAIQRLWHYPLGPPALPAFTSYHPPGVANRRAEEADWYRRDEKWWCGGLGTQRRRQLAEMGDLLAEMAYLASNEVLRFERFEKSTTTQTNDWG